MSAGPWVEIAIPVIKELIGVATFLIPAPGVPEIKLLKDSEETEVNSERIKLVRKLLNEVKEETPCPSCAKKVADIDKEVAALEKETITQEKVLRLREDLTSLLNTAKEDFPEWTSGGESVLQKSMTQYDAVQRDTAEHDAVGSSGNVGVRTPTENELRVMIPSGEQRGGRPVTGKTHVGQSDEEYCLECVEGHTMKAHTEMRHAIDRFRTAGEMTEGVKEKVRVAIEEISGIDEDVKSTKGADPKVSEGLDKILDKARWIRKRYGLGGVGLTVGQGGMKDLEALRSDIDSVQESAYKLVGQCPTCLKRLK